MRFLKQVFEDWCLISSPGIVLFYLALMRAAPLVRALTGYYGGNVFFSFDSNGRSVWVIALFGKGAPPLTLSFLRDGPSGLLRMNGREDVTPVPQGERPTTLAGHPEEARFFRAVSKDQDEWSRKRK